MLRIVHICRANRNENEMKPVSRPDASSLPITVRATLGRRAREQCRLCLGAASVWEPQQRVLAAIVIITGIIETSFTARRPYTFHGPVLSVFTFSTGPRRLTQHSQPVVLRVQRVVRFV
jgi:hypothetical protein